MPQLYLRAKYPLQLFVSYVHPVTQQYKLFKKYICNQNSHYEKYRWWSAPQLSSEIEVSITLLCQLCSTYYYTAVQIKNCLESTSVIKVATVTIQMCNHQIDTFSVSKDEWEIKEDTGKAMKNAFYVLQYAK